MLIVEVHTYFSLTTSLFLHRWQDWACDVLVWHHTCCAFLTPYRGVMDKDTPTLKPRRIQNQNVVYRLERRRVCSGQPGAHWYRVRCFHQNLFPNFTVVNVEKPPCFLRKFSPDGRCFIAFSSDQTSLEVKQERDLALCSFIYRFRESKFKPVKPLH